MFYAKTDTRIDILTLGRTPDGWQFQFNNACTPYRMQDTIYKIFILFEKLMASTLTLVPSLINL